MVTGIVVVQPPHSSHNSPFPHALFIRKHYHCIHFISCEHSNFLNHAHPLVILELVPRSPFAHAQRVPYIMACWTAPLFSCVSCSSIISPILNLIYSTWTLEIRRFETLGNSWSATSTQHWWQLQTWSDRHPTTPGEQRWPQTISIPSNFSDFFFFRISWLVSPGVEGFRQFYFCVSSLVTATSLRLRSVFGIPKELTCRLWASPRIISFPGNHQDFYFINRLSCHCHASYLVWLVHSSCCILSWRTL